MQSMIVRVHPSFTEGRFEWMIVKYEATFAPQRAWHLEVTAKPMIVTATLSDLQSCLPGAMVAVHR